MSQKGRSHAPTVMDRLIDAEHQIARGRDRLNDIIDQFTALDARQMQRLRAARTSCSDALSEIKRVLFLIEDMRAAKPGELWPGVNDPPRRQHHR